MKMKSIVFRVALAVSLVLGLVLTVEAALTASQRRDLSRVRRDLARASSFLRRKKLDDAEKLIEEAETKIQVALSCGWSPHCPEISAAART